MALVHLILQSLLHECLQSGGRHEHLRWQEPENPLPQGIAHGLRLTQPWPPRRSPLLARCRLGVGKHRVQIALHAAEGYERRDVVHPLRAAEEFFVELAPFAAPLPSLQPLVPTLHAGQVEHRRDLTPQQLHRLPARVLVPGVQELHVVLLVYEQHAVLHVRVHQLELLVPVLVPVLVPAPHLRLRHRIRRWVDRSGLSLARQHEQRFHRLGPPPRQHRPLKRRAGFGSMRHSRPLAKRRGDVVVSHAAQRLLYERDVFRPVDRALGSQPPPVVGDGRVFRPLDATGICDSLAHGVSVAARVDDGEAFLRVRRHRPARRVHRNFLWNLLRRGTRVVFPASRVVLLAGSRVVPRLSLGRRARGEPFVYLAG
mmetsp:Transcript_1687/g.6560  ORF Transcript_1687/g.6560 Transcript_1687/m.6560 type:complete len:370 (-) Transcript_1687:124-1233(-)